MYEVIRAGVLPCPDNVARLVMLDDVDVLPIVAGSIERLPVITEAILGHALLALTDELWVIGLEINLDLLALVGLDQLVDRPGPVNVDDALVVARVDEIH